MITNQPVIPLLLTATVISPKVKKISSFAINYSVLSGGN